MNDAEKLHHATQQVFFLQAQNTALHHVLATRLAEISGTTFKIEYEAITKELRLQYDRLLLEVEKVDPRLAAEIDIRNDLDSAAENVWRLPEERGPEQEG